MPYEGAAQYDAGVGCPFFFVAQTVRSLRSELDELRGTVSSHRSEVDMLLDGTRRDLSAVAIRNDQVCTAVGKICVQSQALAAPRAQLQSGFIAAIPTKASYKIIFCPRYPQQGFSSVLPN